MTEWSIYEENKVAEMLSNLPSYFFYVRKQEETKSSIDLDIWMRHTIEWDIRCEWEGFGRE